MDGEEVSTNSRFLSQVPVEKKSNNTLFSLEAQINFAIGSPKFFAQKAAKIFPKLPVGTTTLIFSSFAIAPFSYNFAYAYT